MPKEPSIRELYGVLGRLDLTEGARLLYAWLWWYCGRTDECWPSQEALATNLGIRPRELRNRLRELEAAGLIEQTRQGRGKTNRIHLTGTPVPINAAAPEDLTGTSVPLNETPVTGLTGTPVPVRKALDRHACAGGRRGTSLTSKDVSQEVNPLPQASRRARAREKREEEDSGFASTAVQRLCEAGMDVHEAQGWAACLPEAVILEKIKTAAAEARVNPHGYLRRCLLNLKAQQSAPDAQDLSRQSKRLGERVAEEERRGAERAAMLRARWEGLDAERRQALLDEVRRPGSPFHGRRVDNPIVLAAAWALMAAADGV